MTSAPVAQTAVGSSELKTLRQPLTMPTRFEKQRNIASWQAYPFLKMSLSVSVMSIGAIQPDFGAWL